ncbi:MAG TPA: small multi-drug export protein [Planctomycetes bacterium]|nr:small multi-drug export protein [Planctomycetota bacterium]HIJ71081.1 small multi-drug export protein [Planctomycetota bacterium]
MEEQLQQTTSESRPRGKLRSTLLNSPEGRLLLVGVVLSLSYTFWLGIKVLFSPAESQLLVVMTATQIIFGRAASMAFGYSAGFGHWTVIPACMVIETIVVLVFYPLFVLSWRRLLVINRLSNIFERTRAAAEARKGIIQKYGIVGLFVFVWFPLWMTGPMVGCVIGFLLGLRIRLTMAAVLGGTYVAIFGWAFFLRRFHDLVASYSSYAAMVLMTVLIVFVIILGHLLHRTRQDGKDS